MKSKRFLMKFWDVRGVRCRAVVPALSRKMAIEAIRVAGWTSDSRITARETLLRLRLPCVNSTIRRFGIRK